jgi:chemotaxis protein MotB
MPVKPRNVIDEDDPRVAKIGHPAPPWLVNYADLMTEMVCFFIILYALSAVLNPDIQKAHQQVEEMIKKGEIKGKGEMTPEGYKITLEEKEGKVYFESGKDELTPFAMESIDKLAPVLLKLPNEIVVEGHTDNVPIGEKTKSKFASNWELSTARATNVVRYLVSKWQFNPARLSAIGYGEYRPAAPNDTEENRAKNRRVVFLVKNPPPEEQWKKFK